MKSKKNAANSEGEIFHVIADFQAKKNSQLRLQKIQMNWEVTISEGCRKIKEQLVFRH
ncbi:hypothetical protein T4B_454 [Trichinella pseudospiralis]|uniref:Uncharacterized protein n=1 Tax=Trichinella pseudospiralis TaxID=6337 RepID=A0A0V1GM86_TRIPS|nr:hypothetical protein T4B_454 [Trichinella pseudospiralis]